MGPISLQAFVYNTGTCVCSLGWNGDGIWPPLHRWCLLHVALALSFTVASFAAIGMTSIACSTLLVLRWYDNLYNELTSRYLWILELIIHMRISYFSFLFSFLLYFLPESSLARTTYNENEFRCYIRNPGTILLHRYLSLSSTAIKFIIRFMAD